MTDIKTIEQQLHQARSAEEKLELLHRLAQHYWNSDLERTVDCMLEAIEIARDSNNLPMLAKSLMRAGVSYRSLLQHEPALQYLNDSLALASQLGLQELEASINNSIGALYENLGEYETSLEYFKKCFVLAQECGNFSFQARSMLNIGLISDHLGNYGGALEAYLRSKRLFEEHTDETSAPVLKRMGNLFMEMGSPTQAAEYLLKSLRLFENYNAVRELAPLYTDIASAYLEQGNNELALKNYQKAVELYATSGDRDQKIVSLSLFAGFCFKTGDFTKGWQLIAETKEILKNSKAVFAEAVIFLEEGIGLMLSDNYSEAKISFEKSLDIAHSIKSNILAAKVLRELGLLHERAGNDAKAIESFERSNELFGDVKGRVFLKNLESLCVLYEKAGDFKKVAEYYKRYYERKKELANTESDFATAAILVEFETERTRQEAEIYRLKNVELAEANARLMELSEERKEFISIAAHDLKNPLYSIKMLLSFVKTYDLIFPDDVKDALVDIESASVGMLDLIQNLLDTEIIESGKLQFNVVSISASEIITNIIERYQPAATAKNIQLRAELDEDAIVTADQRYYAQVIDNVLSNAIKYSPLGKNITVRLLENAETQTARCEIQDEGPGINADDMKKLFGKFQRLSARPTANEHSTGLGLAIVKKLTEAMNGRVWCESEVGRGSTFIIEMPSV